MINKLKTFWQSIVQLFMGQGKEAIQSDEEYLEGAKISKSVKRKQDLILLGALGIGIIGMAIWNTITNYKADSVNKEKKESAPLKLEIASSALDPDKMWRNLFEDKLTLTKEETDKKLELIETSLSEASQAHQNQLKAEVQHNTIRYRL